ncbi:MAG: YdbL family protein [Xanthomonadaceae bacterium]|nr:YdbL family protein [Xanthomonadaceae bacterium]MDP2184071.1 YdbL family protein [Xanthomonadales bacterium]MDZ4115718.1 YdbL family protein [Xanthomonadaceae bacterium]MDZ4379139.1 YdbL family protein [Xanthomonadaceae bacterium]
MRKFLVSGVVAALLLSACVTINVYFPAAEAQEAAKEFVDKVIGVDANPGASVPADSSGGGMAWLSFFIADAHAQAADITIRTPAIQTIQDRMAQRYQGKLAPLFAAGALGFGNDGLVQVRDAAAVPLRERATLSGLVAEENRDRNAAYREIAVANGHPDWENQIRETFARQWVDSAPGGSWYQDRSGNWKQK